MEQKYTGYYQDNDTRALFSPAETQPYIQDKYKYQNKTGMLILILNYGARLFLRSRRLKHLLDKKINSRLVN